MVVFREPAVKQVLYKGPRSREFNFWQAEATNAVPVSLPARLDTVVDKGHETRCHNDTAKGLEKAAHVVGNMMSYQVAGWTSSSACCWLENLKESG